VAEAEEQKTPEENGTGALDEKGKPTRVPPLILTSDQERERYEQGRQRHERCRRDLMASDEDYRACREEPLP